MAQSGHPYFCVDGRGHYRPRRVDIFVIPVEGKRYKPQRKDQPGINRTITASFKTHIGKLNRIYPCLGGRFTAVVMTWVPRPDFSAYYQLAIGALASLNSRRNLITFHKHLNMSLAFFF